jgi:hypothetical protein
MSYSKLSNKQILDIANLYQDSSVKMDEICNLFKVSDDTVVRAMKRIGVPMRVTVGYCNEKNSNWKGGNSLHYAKNVAIRHFKVNKCMACGYDISTDVHHWDKDVNHNQSDNLVLLCPNHHREVHIGLITKKNLKIKM